MDVSAMPTAGAIVPPQITPLRKPVAGQPSTHIDTATYIELDTGKQTVSVFDVPQNISGPSRS